MPEPVLRTRAIRTRTATQIPIPVSIATATGPLRTPTRITIRPDAGAEAG